LRGWYPPERPQGDDGRKALYAEKLKEAFGAGAQDKNPKGGEESN